MMRCIIDQRYTTTGLLLLFACAAVAQTPAPGEIRITLLGTSPTVGRAQTSTLVEAGPERFLIDAGSGALERLVRAGFLMDSPSKLFITHLHSDHIVGIPDLLLAPWTGPSQRKVPFEVWGPLGPDAIALAGRQHSPFEAGRQCLDLRSHHDAAAFCRR